MSLQSFVRTLLRRPALMIYSVSFQMFSHCYFEAGNWTLLGILTQPERKILEEPSFANGHVDKSKSLTDYSTSTLSLLTAKSQIDTSIPEGLSNISSHLFLLLKKKKNLLKSSFKQDKVMSSTVCLEDWAALCHLVTLQPSEEGCASSVCGTAGVSTLTVLPATKTRTAHC